MKKLIILMIVLFAIKTNQAQVSGYMGNKFSIIYNGSISFPHLRSYYIQNEVGEDEVAFEIMPTYTNSLNLEYVITNTVAFGLRYRMAMNWASNYNAYKDYIGYENKMKYYGHTYGAYFKFYRRNSLAPIGLYTIVGAGVQQLVLLDVVKPNYLTEKITKQNYSQFDVVLNVGIGRNWIVLDKILLGFQVETGLTYASLARIAGLGVATGQTYSNEFNGYDSTNISSRFNFTSEILRISLNLGFLVF